MQLFDAHCHLPDDKLFPTLGNVMERAAAAGVEGMTVCGTSPADWPRVFQCSEKYAQIYPMIGIHPWFVGGRDSSPSCPEAADRPAVEPCLDDFQCLEKRLRDFPTLGIGETGLDFQDRFENRPEQEASFRAHLTLATELRRPVAIHCVQAWGKMMEILREFPEPKKNLHAFGGAEELIPELTELNCFFSFCGNVTDPKFKRVRAAAAAVPEDRLLVETDSPDFPPAGCSVPNEPANLIHVVRAVAELRSISAEQVARQTCLNAYFYTN